MSRGRKWTNRHACGCDRLQGTFSDQTMKVKIVVCLSCETEERVGNMTEVSIALRPPTVVLLAGPRTGDK